jgi:hypothetical protein
MMKNAEMISKGRRVSIRNRSDENHLHFSTFTLADGYAKKNDNNNKKGKDRVQKEKQKNKKYTEHKLCAYPTANQNLIPPKHPEFFIFLICFLTKKCYCWLSLLRLAGREEPESVASVSRDRERPEPSLDGAKVPAGERDMSLSLNWSRKLFPQLDLECSSKIASLLNIK